MLEAAKHCESMATELLALASALEGAARLLTAQDRRQMPLLDILVEQEQKEVISHPAVQRYNGHHGNFYCFSYVASFYHLFGFACVFHSAIDTTRFPSSGKFTN